MAKTAHITVLSIEAEHLEALPNLDQMSLEEMIDYLGHTRRIIKLLEKHEGYMKEAVKARAPEGEETYGNVFFCIPEPRERVSLDQGAVKDELGEDWCKDHVNVTEYTQLTVKLIPETEDA